MCGTPCHPGAPLLRTPLLHTPPPLLPWPRSDLGCQIDGYISQAAHSLVVAADPAAPVTGRAADVIQAAVTCFEAAARLMRPGKKISDVPGPLATIAESYGCK